MTRTTEPPPSPSAVAGPEPTAPALTPLPAAAAADAPESGRALAVSAASVAWPFAEQIAHRCASIVHGLRAGLDEDALDALTLTTVDLEHFLTFLVLLDEWVTGEGGLRGQLLAYRQRVLGVVESIQPALGEIDLVEVADALESDLIPSLRDYINLDEDVREALRTAA
jgi:hypothetical protein